MKPTRSMRWRAFSAVLVASLCTGAWAETIFRHTITGEDLKIDETSLPEGRDTPGVKQFLETGVNPYTEQGSCLPRGEETYLVACSGCHGHVGEGKVGPGLNDAYWTYPKNKTDNGLFETIYGGANGMMGPHNDLPLDEILALMAWVRHIYTGPLEEADWLSDEQKKTFKPYVDHKPFAEQPDGETQLAAMKAECKVAVR